MNKVVNSFDEAVADIRDGATVMIGCFGDPGPAPSWLIRAVAKRGAKNLTLISNIAGWGRRIIPQQAERLSSLIKFPPWYDDCGLLVENKQVHKVICSWAGAITPTTVNAFEEQYGRGEVELELVPQGTLAERIRAGKVGIAAFYTPTGAGSGTIIEQGKEVRMFGRKKYLLEYALKADFALIRAYKTDRWGNLIYKGTMRGFNSVMAGAANVTIAEVDEIVELGELDPENIVTPAVYVDRVVARPKEAQQW